LRIGYGLPCNGYLDHCPRAKVVQRFLRIARSSRALIRLIGRRTASPPRKRFILRRSDDGRALAQHGLRFNRQEVTRMKRRLWLVLLVLICLPSYAQLQTGNIFGHTVAKDGTAIPGASVTLTGPGAPQTFITDASGSFRFLNLSPGTYALKTDLSGFAMTTRLGISVNIGRNADVTLTMNPAASDSIVVS